MRRALSAMPIPAGSPCPSDPVATSTNGNRGVGCPSKSDPIVRSFSSSDRSNAPASAQAAYRIGAACPFDSTNRSAPACRGRFGSNRNSPKKSDAMISAADMQLVGWPLPAAVVARTESMRSRVAMLWRAGMGAVECPDTVTSL
jgi:hypothetical protein